MQDVLRRLATCVTSYDQPSLQIMQMLYCFVKNIHVDYAELLWEGFHYLLINPTAMIPYHRFTKLIMSHYMTTFSDISRGACDRYHNTMDDVMIKSIFNSRKCKGVIGMKIPDWMITDEIKFTENYWLYAEVFGVDVPTTQSQPIESTRQRIEQLVPLGHLTLLLIKENQVLHEEQKGREDLIATKNVEKVKEHLMAEEIEKLVEGTKNVAENVEVASSPLRNDDNQSNLDIRKKNQQKMIISETKGEREGDRGV
nr:hypothetical protein [Tanacetum cinerariifolium]